MYVDLQARSRAILAPRAMSLLALLAYSMSPGARAPEISPAGSDPRSAQALPPTAGAVTTAPANVREQDVITVTAPKASPLMAIMAPKIPRQPVPASDGADYLKTIPGFAVVRNGGTNGDPVFRGTFGSRLRILVDGGEMLGACSSRMDSPSAYIPPESFDLVSLTKGPQTVLWGPGASAGTLRFERVRPRFDAPGITLHASTLAGSSGRLDQNVDGAFGNPFGYLRLLGNVSRAGDYQDGAGQRVHSGWHKRNSDVAVGFTPTPDAVMELTVGRGDGKARYAGRGMDGTRFARESLGMRFEQRALGEMLESVEMQGWYHYTDHVMDNHARRIARRLACQASAVPGNWTPCRSNVDRLTLGGRGISTWQWQEVQLQSGADIQVNRHRRKSGGQWQQDAQFQDSGVFAEVSWRFKPAQTLISGMRLEHTAAQYNCARRTERRSEVYPTAFVRLEHQAETLPLMAYVGAGLSERFPDYWELITLSSGRRAGQDAFYRLKREKTAQIDLGAHLQFAPLDAWVSAYVGQVRDFILFRYGIPPENISRADNIDARIHGGETGLAYRFNDHWRLESSLAWAFGENRDTHRRPLPQIPPLEGRLALSWEQGDWSATGLWRLVAAQQRVTLNEGNVVGKDFDRSTGFGVLSANVAWQAATTIKLSAGVDNLLNRGYSEHLNLVGNRGFGYAADAPLMEPGRTLWARAGITF
ncbi:MAG: TonB-dependent copper receptor [Sodalis sp. (in: enterobacteria)]|uniref:TonB-dependent copper receptor n=1 Tax=Sodalis sp. (in: enterobacteria) TaxID=1898979 RepID=UPI003F2F5B58